MNGQFESDLSLFMERFGVTNKTPIYHRRFPIHGARAVRRIDKLKHDRELALKLGIKNTDTLDLHLTDHPRVWLHDKNIACCTCSFYDHSPYDEYMVDLQKVYEYAIGDRYNILAFSANEVNCYFDKNDWSKCYQEMGEDKFRNECLSKHCTLVLVPKRKQNGT